jgi:hypothetical protein
MSLTISFYSRTMPFSSQLIHLEESLCVLCFYQNSCSQIHLSLLQDLTNNLLFSSSCMNLARKFDIFKTTLNCWISCSNFYPTSSTLIFQLYYLKGWGYYSFLRSYYLFFKINNQQTAIDLSLLHLSNSLIPHIWIDF